MDGNLFFLNLEGLDDSQVKHLNGLLNPSNVSPEIEFPWTGIGDEEKVLSKSTSSSLNVHAPVFEAYATKIHNPCVSLEGNHLGREISFCEGTNEQTVVNPNILMNYSHNYSALNSRTLPQHSVSNYSNGSVVPTAFTVYNQSMVYSGLSNDVSGELVKPKTEPISSAATFKLNPAVSCFVPSSFQHSASRNEKKPDTETKVVDCCKSPVLDKNSETVQEKSESETAKKFQNGTEAKAMSVTENSSEIFKPRSWADIVSKGQKSNEKTTNATTKPLENGDKSMKCAPKDTESDNSSLEEDKLALPLGKHLYQLALNLEPVFLQPRGLINRRNWCYINATLQALLACPPFYTLLKNLPVSNSVERGKSATPVIDSMVKMALEFSEFDSPQEELQTGQPFQPDFIYDMLKDMKSDCLKGQQEDAEEFLSFILNGMHEEMVKVIKYYEKKNNLNVESEEVKENGDVSDGEEEWQVITGSKHKAMVTRKVAEHRSPVSELLGGQIKSFLTTSGSKTSASIQPFFTLQLDVQSENVTSVSEALKEMTVKEPIQGYTCAKTKQEVEAYSHIALQKLPPILILHLKRFVYNKNGGCKKVMKKTDYPLELELNRDLFSSDVKRCQRVRVYKLFAVMYHDGEEAVKGHYISDVYNYGCQTWVRCDDRTISVVNESLVLSHSPPRVPYLLFYHES